MLVCSSEFSNSIHQVDKARVVLIGHLRIPFIPPGIVLGALRSERPPHGIKFRSRLEFLSGVVEQFGAEEQIADCDGVAAQGKRPVQVPFGVFCQ